MLLETPGETGEEMVWIRQALGAQSGPVLAVTTLARAWIQRRGERSHQELVSGLGPWQTGQTEPSKG